MKGENGDVRLWWKGIKFQKKQRRELETVAPIQGLRGRKMKVGSVDTIMEQLRGRIDRPGTPKVRFRQTEFQKRYEQALMPQKLRRGAK